MAQKNIRSSNDNKNLQLLINIEDLHYLNNPKSIPDKLMQGMPEILPQQTIKSVKAEPID